MGQGHQDDDEQFFGIGGRQESEIPGQGDSDTEMGRIQEESKDTMNEEKIPKSESKGPKKIGRWT